MYFDLIFLFVTTEFLIKWFAFQAFHSIQQKNYIF